MSLDDLSAAVESTYADLGDELAVSLDGETRTELAMLTAALDPERTDDLLGRAVHLLFQQTVDTGKLDFHLRSSFDVTYDEYLSGMTYEDMTGGYSPPKDDNARRYQF